MIADYRNRHQGESMLVCGTGPSLLDVPKNPPIASIGVNMCHEWGHTDYLVILGNMHAHRTPERRRIINNSTPKAFFIKRGGDEKEWGDYWKTNKLPAAESTIVPFAYDFPRGPCLA